MPTNPPYGLEDNIKTLEKVIENHKEHNLSVQQVIALSIVLVMAEKFMEKML